MKSSECTITARSPYFRPDRRGFENLCGLTFFAISLALLFSACRSAPPPTLTKTTPSLANLPQGWTKIEPGGETRCAHNTPYAYWVRPGTTNKVFVYFQGGGCCYNAETCGLKGSYKDEVTDNDDPKFTIGGVFNLDRP